MLFGGKKITCVVNYNNKKYSFDLERHKTIEDLYDLFLTKLNIKTESYYSFSIYLTSVYNKNQKKTFNNYEIKGKDKPLFTFIGKDIENDSSLFFDFYKIFKCKSCQTTSINEEIYITKYCLNCNIYLCNVCLRNNNKHSGHVLVDVNFKNVKDSIKLWNINLNADLSNQITSFNKLISIVYDNNSEVKLNMWKNRIISKLNSFENLINNLYDKFTSLKNFFKELQDTLNKTMFNLSKTEKEIEFLDNKKIISLDDAENIIQKFKNNYIEIFSVKNKINNVIDIQSFIKMDELMTNLSIQFDELFKTVVITLNNSPILQNNHYALKLTNKKLNEGKNNMNSIFHSVDNYTMKNNLKKIYSYDIYNDKFINEVVLDKSKDRDKKSNNEHERMLTTPELSENINPIKVIDKRRKTTSMGYYSRNSNIDTEIKIIKQNTTNSTGNNNNGTKLPKIVIKNLNKKNLNHKASFLKNKTTNNCLNDG